MKISTSLLIALGMMSHAALAQLHPPPEPLPAPGAQPGLNGQPDITPQPPSDVVPGRLPDASGASGTVPGSSGASDPAGTSSTPPDSASGGAADSPSSGASGLQTEAGAELRSSPAPVAQLQPQTQDDVTYLCGGVGQEEVSYMKQEARGYDLMLTFAARDGTYLADVDVDIRDAKGNTVLQTNCDAPIMLVDLPRSGTYRIHADAAGYQLDRTAKVQDKARKGGRLASVVMSWPQQVAEVPGASETSSGAGAESEGNAGSADSPR